MLPTTLHVVPNDHNGITMLVSPPHHDIVEYHCAFKSKRGIEFDRGWEPVYWYWCKTGRLDFFFKMLPEFQYHPEDELVISEADYNKHLKAFLASPLLDFSSLQVQVVSDINDAFQRVMDRRSVGAHGHFIFEPTTESPQWRHELWCPAGGGGGKYDSIERLLVALQYKSHFFQSDTLYLTESALEAIRPIADAPVSSALPFTIVENSDLPKIVYETKSVSFLTILGAFLRWRANT